MSRNLLALDLATRTGWALMENGRLESGADTFDVKRGESPGTRYMRFNRWLDGMVFAQATNGQGLVESVGAPRVGLIVYEQSHNRGGAATEVAAGFTTRVQEFCARHGIEHAACHTQTLKKFVTGRGNADKAAMIEAVSRRWRRIEDDNEGDAIALCFWALENLVGGGR